MAITSKICRVDTTNSTITDIKAFLVAKGLVTLEKYLSTTCYIFTTPLTSKVVKITIDTHTGIQISVGDAWTSGTTITNEMIFACSGHDWATLTHAQIIADSTYIIFHSITQNNQGVAYIGALSNGNPFVFGLCTRYDANSSFNNFAYDLSTGNPVRPVSFGGNISFRKKADGNLFTMPLMWTTQSGDLQMNGTDPAGTIGIKCTSIFPRLGNGGVVFSGGEDYILTGAPLYIRNNSDFPFFTSLLIPIA